MKKIITILAILTAFVVNSQNVIQLTASKTYDPNGNTISSTTATVYVSISNIAALNASGSGSIIYLRNTFKNQNGVVASYSVTSTQAQIDNAIKTTTVFNPVSTAYTTSATVTASELAGGLLTINSGTLAVTLTLPTSSLIATQIGAQAGSYFEFSVNNSGSGGTVTVAVGSGMTASGFPSSNTLTLANSATVGIARFRITFISATASTLTRIN